MRWADLKPDAALLGALDAADAGGARSSVLNGRSGPAKNGWSNRFADACARMVADRLRRHRAFKRLEVLPDPGGRNEPPTFVAGDKKKKVDVVAASFVSGLQVGISLKGMNFRDQGGSLNFDKNLTGRTYELQDEVRLVHGYQPAAFMVGLYFLPIGATTDKKTERAASSFAHAVEHLRARTGRVDPTLPSQLDRVDMAAVALFVAGDEERFTYTDRGEDRLFEYNDPLPRGVVRYFDVNEAPPFRGRPRIETTLDLDGLVDLIARYRSGEPAGSIDFADPEPDI